MDKCLAIIVLAAGKGTRMKSKHPKVLHKLCGKPMIEYVLHTVFKLGSKKNFLVLGYKKDKIREEIAKRFSSLAGRFNFVIQKELLGSGNAVLQVKKFLKGFKNSVLVISGDTPLIEKVTLIKLLRKHKEEGNVATLLTTEMEQPFSYGRIIRSKNNEVEKIVEEKEATLQEKKIKEVNSGIYCFSSNILFKALHLVNPSNIKGEYYLTDVIKILKEQKCKIGAYKIKESSQVIGVNDRKNLAYVERLIRMRILERLMLEGVTIINPEETYIEDSVKIGKDTVILPGVIIRGETWIGENCSIGPYTLIKDSHIENKVEIQISVLEKASISSKTNIKPFSYIKGKSGCL